MTDWPALYRALTADIVENVDNVEADRGRHNVNKVNNVNVSKEEREATASPSFFRSLTADNVDNVDNVSTARGDAGKASTARRYTVNKVNNVSLSEGKEGGLPSLLWRRPSPPWSGNRPDRVEIAAWQHAIEDGRRLLIQWGERAAALGWTAEDLFGLHPVGLLRRYDVMGLVWLLQGRRVVALTESTAVIKGPSGNELTFYRRDAEFPWRRARRNEVVEPDRL